MCRATARKIYIDAELETVETATYFPKIYRKDFVIGLNLQTSGPDPDPVLDLFYGCDSSLNWDGYCNPEVDKLIAQQSLEADEARRKQLVWTIERKLAEDGARPIIFYSRNGTCWRPYVKGMTLMVNSIFNGNRREDVWLAK
jgi:peptide/nickel transport system substrate-binding protein